MADEPVIEEPPKPPEPPVYKHSLSGHAVSGDGTFEETKAATATDDYRQEKLPEFTDFAKAVSGAKEEEEKPLEPLPEIPKMPMTVDDAYDFLEVKKEDRGNLDKVRPPLRCARPMRVRHVCAHRPSARAVLAGQDALPQDEPQVAPG